MARNRRFVLKGLCSGAAQTTRGGNRQRQRGSTGNPLRLILERLSTFIRLAISCILILTQNHGLDGACIVPIHSDRSITTIPTPASSTVTRLSSLICSSSPARSAPSSSYSSSSASSSWVSYAEHNLRITRNPTQYLNLLHTPSLSSACLAVLKASNLALLSLT